MGAVILPDKYVPGDIVLRDLLIKHAEKTPDSTFAIFSDVSFTYKEMHDEVRRLAAGLQLLGVKQQDPVLVWLPNGLEHTLIWFAINYIGAIFVSVNTAYRGGLLEHVLRNSATSIGIIHAGLMERLASIDVFDLAKIVVVGASPTAGAAPPAMTTVPFSELLVDNEPQPLMRPIRPWDTQSIVYTSGTTGPSKGVLSSYCHLHTLAMGLTHGPDEIPFLDNRDRAFVVSPLFHVSGTAPIYMMLSLGGSFAMPPGFSTSTFWRDVSATKSTYAVFLGVMAAFLVKQDVSPPMDCTLRLVNIVPLTPDAIMFGKRFGVDVHTIYGMSELAIPIHSNLNPTEAGMCGQLRKGFEVRIVDKNDYEVENSETGELIVRADQPWTLNHGYNSNDGATAKAWRNGWFHTGDSFRKIGNTYYFVDRLNDVIRRRGENISSVEIENEVCAYPAVREAAAIAVSAEEGEDEVLVAVSAVPGLAIDPLELFSFLQVRLAYFMLPRFIRVLPDLPKTPSGKVEKARIRAEGLVEGTWDRVSAGINVTRDRLQK